MDFVATLYLDIDGVVNFFGSRTQHRKHSGLSYQRRGAAVAYHPHLGNHPFEMNWSAELLKTLSEAEGLEVALLSTWNDSSENLFRTLDWSADRVLPPVRRPGTLSEENKLWELVKDQEENPRPFIWADDTATILAPKLDLEVESLILKPDDSLGMTKDELNSVIEFVESLKS